MATKLSKRMEEIVQESNLTIKEIATLTNLSAGTIRNAIKTRTCSADTAKRLADVLGGGVVYLIDPEDPYGIRRRLSEAEEAGNFYEVKAHLEMFHVVIRHPTEGDIIRGSMSSFARAEEKMQEFNKALGAGGVQSDLYTI